MQDPFLFVFVFAFVFVLFCFVLRQYSSIALEPVVELALFLKVYEILTSSTEPSQVDKKGLLIAPPLSGAAYGCCLTQSQRNYCLYSST